MKGIGITCPVCQKKVPIIAVLFGDNGEIIFKAVCEPCGIPMDYETTYQDIMVMMFHGEEPKKPNGKAD